MSLLLLTWKNQHTLLFCSVCWLGSFEFRTAEKRSYLLQLQFIFFFALLVASAVIGAYLTLLIEIIFNLFVITEAIARRSFVKMVFLKVKQNSKQLCRKLLFNKVAGPLPAILLNKRLQNRYFPMNFAILLSIAKFLRTSFLFNTSR